MLGKYGGKTKLIFSASLPCSKNVAAPLNRGKPYLSNKIIYSK